MFLQPTEPRFLIPVLSLCNITVRYSALWGGPGPRFEPRTGSLEAGTLTTRPPHLHTTKEVWWSTSTIIRWFPSTEIQSNDEIYLHPWGTVTYDVFRISRGGINSRIVRHKKAQLFSSGVQDSVLRKIWMRFLKCRGSESERMLTLLPNRNLFLSDSVSGLDFSENNMIPVPVLLKLVTVPVCIYIFNYYTVINFIQPVYNTIGADFWHEYSLKPKFFRN